MANRCWFLVENNSSSKDLSPDEKTN